MYEPQLQIDFIRWLGELSKDIESRYSRRFEDANGNCEGEDYCTECVELELTERLAASNPMCEVNGWNEAHEEDSQPFCSRCGCLLECSPTREMIESELEWLSTVEELDAVNAWSLHNWLDGMGAYDEDRDWPKIEPHAIRLMTKADVEVVPVGFVTYRPAFDDWYDFDSIWLVIYEWYANKLLDWIHDTGEGGLEYLVDTSGVHLAELQSIGRREKPKEVIDKLLLHVGKNDGRGKFLASIGLATLADMEKPIRLADQRCNWPEFDVRGRVLNHSPNSCHPNAKVLTHSELRFCSVNRRWFYRAFYDYFHYDRSSWCVDVYQGKEECLPVFMQRVCDEMDAQLVPVDHDDRYRMNRLKRWDEARSALNTVFYIPVRGECDDDVMLTDLLLGIEGSVNSQNRIKLTPNRIATLKRWIKTDPSKLA